MGFDCQCSQAAVECETDHVTGLAFDGCAGLEDVGVGAEVVEPLIVQLGVGDVGGGFQQCGPQGVGVHVVVSVMPDGVQVPPVWGGDTDPPDPWGEHHW